MCSSILEELNFLGDILDSLFSNVARPSSSMITVVVEPAGKAGPSQTGEEFLVPLLRYDTADFLISP